MTGRVEHTAWVRCTPTAVYDALGDPELLMRRLALSGKPTVLRHDLHPEGLSMEAATAVPLDWVPTALRAGLGSGAHVVRQEEWRLLDEDHLVGEQHFHVTDAGARGQGRTELVRCGDRTRLTASLEVRVGLPVVGTVIEKAILPRLESGLHDEIAWYDALAESGR